MKAKINKILLLSLILLLSSCKFIKPDEEDYPEQPKKNSALAAKTNVALGFDYIHKHHLDIAKDKFIQAIKDDPKLPDVWYSMAYFLEITGNTSEAGRLYKKAIEIAPYDGKARNNYGTFLCRQHEYNRAIQEFIYAAKQPSYLAVGAAYENAGLCSILAKKPIAAEEFFKLAIHNDPNRALSYFELAKLNFDNSKVKTSYHYYSQYAELSHRPLNDYYRQMFEPIAHHSDEEREKSPTHVFVNNTLAPSRETVDEKLAELKPVPQTPETRLAEREPNNSAAQVAEAKPTIQETRVAELEPRDAAPQTVSTPRAVEHSENKATQLSEAEAQAVEHSENSTAQIANADPQTQEIKHPENTPTQLSQAEAQAQIQAEANAMPAGEAKKSDFHIQLYASQDKEHADEFVMNLPNELQNKVHIVAIEQNGQRLYHVLIGDFSSKSEATMALDNLSDSLKQYHPWVNIY